MLKNSRYVPANTTATVASDCPQYTATGDFADVPCTSGATSNSEWSGSTLSTNLSTSATNYFTVMGAVAPSATEANFELPVTVQTTFSKLSCHLSGTPGGSATYAFTLDTAPEVGGTVTASALSAIIGSAEQFHRDDTHSATVPADSVVSIKAVPSGTPTARTARCTVQANM